MRKFMLAMALLGIAMPAHAATAPTDGRWTPAQANTWYTKQAWPAGGNYIPANAINQFEMWQADSFDPKRIDLELGWAQGLGLTTMRVFLHDMLWRQDAAGFKTRIGQFLAIAARHHIKPIFVLFDSCWDPNPKLGKQHAPVPGVHNSGWVQGPGAAALADPAQYPRLQAYVKDIVGSFAKDDRILAWDVWNEPDNSGGGHYPDNVPAKLAHVTELLPQVFAWARSQNPSQPLTSGVWHDDNWNDLRHLNAVEKTQLTQSDVISFHNYDWPEIFEARAKSLLGYGRPILCTEYMARGNGSTFDTIMPIGKRMNIAMVNWGFVDGKTQTRMPWESWAHPYVKMQPPVWFHEILHTDGTPYRAREIAIIRALTGSPKGVVPPLPN